MMKEVKFYYIERVTEDVLKEARDIATMHNCVVQLLWQPNRWNPEQKITITSDTTDDNIRTMQKWSRGPWGM